MGPERCDGESDSYGSGQSVTVDESYSTGQCVDARSETTAIHNVVAFTGDDTVGRIHLLRSETPEREVPGAECESGPQ